MSPGQADVAVVRRHLLALDAALARLRRHAGRPLAALRDDPDAQWVVERGLQLGELGVLPPEFAARFRGVAGFRNVLVHGYLAVDLARVHQLLNAVPMGA